MKEIDGSHGEGGGQILRTAIAMSMINGESVNIKNIRANRPNPGLSHQHLMAIKAAKEISDAEAEGLKKGSETVTFTPNDIKGGFYRFDIGTAGSITLLLQAVLLPAFLSDEPITIEVKGGTDVKWSPPYDYFENIFLENVKKMGGEVSLECIKRGHYPKGGGKVKIKTEPSEIDSLEAGKKIDKVKGKAFVTNLPDHIAERMKKSALKELIEYETSISIESYQSPSAGTALTLWTQGDRILGNGILGEKGVPAEEIGKKTAEGVIDDIEEGMDLDIWCADQIIPYLSMAKNCGKLKVKETTGHLETNIWVVNQFIDKKIELKERNGFIWVEY
ncbi:MAG: RNA 3'-terminal phosphate cyclase [Thermoplasmata archaeon]